MTVCLIQPFLRPSKFGTCLNVRKYSSLGPPSCNLERVLNMTGAIKYGIIGTGMIGREHIRNILLLEQVEIVAVADSDDNSLELARTCLNKKVSSCSYYKQYSELLRNPSVEVVVICTPNYHHHEILMEALPMNKHIFCEKPLCFRSLKQCAEVEAAAKTTGKYILSNAENIKEELIRGKKLFYTGMEYRFYPSIKRFVEEVHSGTIGKLCMLSIQEHRFPFLAKVGNWNRFALNTGGTLVEKACHFFDLMQLVIRSKPYSIYASGDQSINHLNERYDSSTLIMRNSGAEVIFERNDYTDNKPLIPDILDNAFVTVEFENGVRALLDLCMFAEVSTHQEHLSATGSKGKVEAFAPSHGEKDTKKASSFLRIGRRKEWVTRDSAPDTRTFNPIEEIKVELDPKLIEIGDHGGATYFEHLAMIQILRRGSDHGISANKFVSFEDGVLAVCIGIAANRSIKEKRVVKMDEISKEYHAYM